MSSVSNDGFIGDEITPSSSLIYEDPVRNTVDGEYDSTWIQPNNHGLVIRLHANGMLGRYFFMWAYLVGAKTVEGIDGQCVIKK
jgi:hypothetical protein